MIKLTRLNHSKIMINAEMIQSLHAAPDTIITFTNNDKLMVREQVEEVSEKIITYRKAVHHNPPYMDYTGVQEQQYLV